MIDISNLDNTTANAGNNEQNNIDMEGMNQIIDNDNESDSDESESHHETASEDNEEMEYLQEDDRSTSDVEDMNQNINEESDNDFENDIEQNEDIMEANETPAELEEMDARYGMRTSSYNLRPRRVRDYSHLHVTLDHVVMTQYSLKKGIQQFGDAGIKAVLDELKQLHDRKVLDPVYGSELQYHERKKALPYLMFIKQKKSGKIKGRGCADGRKQRDTIDRTEVSSPTVAMESIFITSVIDAKECRDVATVDIPGAFMQADIDDLVHLRLDGPIVELLAQIEPQLYRKFIIAERGKKVLYVKLRKALYGTIQAAFLFWKKLTSELIKMGFITNPYDQCVANKLINGTVCTIIWHVDDLKISHINADVVTSVIDQISEVFGKEVPLTVNRGPTHEYLGMSIDFSEKHKVIINMEKYIYDMINELPIDMIGHASTPAANHLFEVNENDPKYLSEDEAMKFHHVVAKLLFLCKRARPDIHTAVAFLCTRVKKPDEDDYKKLCRVLKYLQSTIEIKLTLEAEDPMTVQWWVDASYAPHVDMRSHTGGMMTLGKGAVYTNSTKQKLTTRSSTEAELVGVHDILPQVIWTKYFLEHQGIMIYNNRLYQDNRSAMILEMNGKGSSGKRTRHINIRYFFIKDRVESKEINIQYCHTHDMIADFFTKPLQGKMFTDFRNIIMNCNAPYGYHHKDHRSVLEMRNSPVVNKDIPTDSQVNIKESLKLSNDASVTKYN